MTAVHHYTFMWQTATGWGNAHFATSHGGPGSHMLSTSNPELQRFYQRSELARTLRAWRHEASVPGASFRLFRGISGWI